MKGESQNFFAGLKRLLIIALALVACWYFRMVLGYIIVSFFLALIFTPFARKLRHVTIFKHKISDWGASAISLLLLWIVVACLVAIIVPLLTHKIQDLGNIDIKSEIESIHTPLEKVFNAVSNMVADGENVQHSITRILDNAMVSLVDFDTMNRTVSEAVSIGFETIIFFFSVSFITFFFIKDETLFYRMVAALFPDRNLKNVGIALRKTDKLLARYLIGLLLESTALTMVLTIVLSIIGMKFSDACFIGMIMGIMNIIPYAGPLIGGILAVFMGLVTPIEGMSGGHTVLITLLAILAIKGIDDFVIQPTIYSERVKAHPLEIFLVVLIAGTIGGIVGMLVAIPAYTVLRVFAKEFFPDTKIVRLLTDDM